MPLITLNGTAFTYQYNTRPRCRTVRLTLTASREIALFGPKGVNASYIEAFLRSKASWIMLRSSKLQLAEQNPVNASLTHGAEILFLGEPHILTLIPLQKARSSVTLTPGQIIVRYAHTPGNEETLVAAIMNKWFIEAARTVFTDRSRKWAQVIGVTPQHIAIRDQKSRWGSCSSRGTISYNWRVVMAPSPVIDYLIVHELCHMLVPNHSAAFWKHVGQHIPCYKEYRAWLHDNADLLAKILVRD